MSKVKFIIESEYVCTALEYLRTMHKTRDYSGLPATVERIQQHVNAMEAGLGQRWLVNQILYDEDLTPEQKVAKLQERYKKES